MKLYFCESCGKRFSDDDVQQGKGFDKQGNGMFCADCAAGVTTANYDGNQKAPPSPAPATRIAHAASPTKSRSSARLAPMHAKTKPQGHTPLYVALSAGVVIIAVGLMAAFRPSAPSRPALPAPPPARAPTPAPAVVKTGPAPGDTAIPKFSPEPVERISVAPPVTPTGAVTYLANLKPISIIAMQETETPLFNENVTVEGKTYDKCILFRPKQFHTTVLRYALNGERRFECEITLRSAKEQAFQVVIFNEADEKIHTQTSNQPISVDISGMKRFMIKCYTAQKQAEDACLILLNPRIE